MTVTKKVIAKNISGKLGLKEKDSLSLSTSFFKFFITNHGRNISIQNFGKFSFKLTPERIGRNPKTLEIFQIKKRKKLTFNPARQVKENIN